MKYTPNLNLPVYDDPEIDVFDLQDLNSANESIDGAYAEMKTYNENEPTRVQNEATRLSNEDNRISNESERVANEEIRKANEINRQALYKEIEKARIDYHNTTHDDLSLRLNEDFDNIHQRVNESSLLPYEGINISAKDTYYGLVKDLNIKGRTLQNIAVDKDTNYGTSGNGAGLRVEKIEGNGAKWIVVNNTIVSYRTIRLRKHKMLKPSTTYTLFFNIVRDGFGLDKTFNINGTSDSYDGNLTNQLYRGNYIIGNNIVKFTTESDISSYSGIGFGLPSVKKDLTPNGAETIIKDVMLIEGDYTNENIHFFEGIKSVGEENNKAEVLSFNRNLFSGFDKEFDVTNEVIENQRIDVTEYLKGLIGETIPPEGITYKADVVAIDHKQKSDTFHYGLDIHFMFSDGTNGWCDFTRQNIKAEGEGTIEKRIVFNNKKHIGKTIIGFFEKDCVVFTRESFGTFTMKNIEIILGNDTSTESTPHEENKAIISLEEPLRSLSNKAFDEITEDRKLIKIVKKVVLTGSEYWALETNPNLETHLCFITAKFLTDATNTSINNNRSPLCDKFIAYSNAFNAQENCVYYTSTKNYLRINISKENLLTQDVDGFKQFLSQNPLTVYYELAEPVITEIEPINLKSYKGATHITSDNLIKPNVSCKIPSNVPAVISALRLENEELQKDNTALEEQIEENNISNIETSLEQDVRLTMLELGVN